MVRKNKFIIGKSKSSRVTLEQRILECNRQLIKLHNKVDLISAWLSKKFGDSFLVEACARVDLKDMSNHFSRFKSTTPQPSNPGLKKAKLHSASGGQHSGSDISAESDVMVYSGSDVDDDDDQTAAVRNPGAGIDGPIPLENGTPEREGQRKRKSKCQRNKMARFQLEANNGQEGNGAKEQRSKKTLAPATPDKGRTKHCCNWPNCHKFFSKSSSLVRHERSHTDVKPFKCTWPHCGKSYSRRDSCIIHHRTHLGLGAKPFKCTWPNCVQSFPSSGHLTTHRRIHTGEKPYVCDWPKCDNLFSTSGNRTAHRRTHTGEKPFACDWPKCNNSFAARSNLTIHRRIHTGERPFKCGFCDYRCAHGSHLTRHTRVHTGEKPYKCRVCAATFKQSTSKITHEKIHHRSH